jgi:hypothetical protein
LTLSERLAEVQKGRRLGLKEGIAALKVELRLVRTAIVASVDEQQKQKLIDRAEVWVCAIEILEALAI